MKKAANLNLLELWLQWGIDLNSRTIYIDGEIDEEKMAMRIRAVNLMIDMDKKKPINIIISSFGGSTYDAFGMYDVLKSCPCPVYTHAHSKVMSGGFMIYLAGQKRFSLPNTTFMMHSVSSGGTEGKTYEQEIDVLESKRLNKIIMLMLEERTKMPKNWWYRKIRTDDLYLDFTLAYQYGIVTEDNNNNKLKVSSNVRHSKKRHKKRSRKTPTRSNPKRRTVGTRKSPRVRSK